MPPRSHASTTALYVAAGVGAGITAGLLHYAVPAALEALEASGLLPAPLARAAAAARRSPTSTTTTSAPGGGEAAAGPEEAPPGGDSSPIAFLTRWLSLSSKVGGPAVGAALSLAGVKQSRRMASAAAAPPTPTPAPTPTPLGGGARHAAVAPPPSRLGRIAVGLPSSSPAAIVTSAPGAGRYYWKPTPTSGPSTPGSAHGRSGGASGGGGGGTGTPSEMVAVLRAKLAGEEPPPLTPSSARSEGEAMVPANYTGARPPLYVSPRAVSGDGAHYHHGAVFRSPSPY